MRYLRERLLAGRTIPNVTTGNRLMLKFLEQTANRRPAPRAS